MKSNTNELRKAVKSIIDEFITAHYLYASEPDKFPYATFEMRELQNVDGRTQINLEVNVFTKQATTAESVADSIQDAFDHANYDGTKIAFYSYRSQRLRIVEDDKTIHRIRLNIELYLYSKEE